MLSINNDKNSIKSGGEFPEKEDQTVRARHSHPKKQKPLWLREFGIEIGLVSATLLAIFLLIEPWEIRKTLFRLVRQIIRVLGKIISSIWSSAADWFKGFSLSDATAFILLAGVIILAGLRLRWRIIRLPRLQSAHCPRCTSVELKRIHRHWFEHLPALLGIPVRRYWCKKCGWRGLRINASKVTKSTQEKT